MRIAESTSAPNLDVNVSMAMDVVDQRRNSTNAIIESSTVLNNYNSSNHSLTGRTNGDCCGVGDSDHGCWQAGSPNSAHSSGSSTAGVAALGLASSSTPLNGSINGMASDAEGVWSPDIDQAFYETLEMYPPCGRRKIILSDEGKMFGRNELIARYIKVRTGKTRTRKQVSSHIQVLARKKLREVHAKIKDQTAKEKALSALSAMSGADMLAHDSLSLSTSQSSMKASDALNTLVNVSVISANAFGCGVGDASATSPSSAVTAACGLPSTAAALHSRDPVAAATTAAINWSQAATLVAAQAAAAAAAARFSPHAPITVPALGNPLTITASSAIDVKPQFAHLAPFLSLTSLQQQQRVHPHVRHPSTAFPPGAFASLPVSAPPPWQGRSICTPKIRLCEFSAYCLLTPKDYKNRHEIVCIPDDVTHADPFLEEIDISQIYDKFPSGANGLRELYRRGSQNAFFLVKFWADISFKVADEQSMVFAVDSRYESCENMTITVSTKACSFGKPIVEKVEHEYAKFENGRFVYRIQRSPLCEYMNNFILKLKTLPERHFMNSVLENFTILQLVTSKETQEVLLCIAVVLEVSKGDGCQHRLYKLTYGNSSDHNNLGIDNGNER